MMTCDDYQLNISRLTDGELADEQSAEVFLHLASCIACREFYTSIHRMNAFLAAEDIDNAPTAHLPAALPGWAEGRERTKPRRWRDRRIEVRSSILAVLVVLLLGMTLAAAMRLGPEKQAETVYVTKLPAIIVTSETQTTHTIN
jgi:anti-sigma factor RsiW